MDEINYAYFYNHLTYIETTGGTSPYSLSTNPPFLGLLLFKDLNKKEFVEILNQNNVLQ